MEGSERGPLCRLSFNRMMIVNHLSNLTSYLPTPPIQLSTIKRVALEKIGMTPLKRSEKMEQLIQKLDTAPLSQEEIANFLQTTCQNLDLESKYQGLSELVQDPRLAPLKQFIQTYFPKDQEEWPYSKSFSWAKLIQKIWTWDCDCCKPDPVDFLQLFLGIKPFYLFTCSAEDKEKLDPFIQSMIDSAKLNPNIKIANASLHRGEDTEAFQYYFFFSNSQSLPLFDLQKYLKSDTADPMEKWQEILSDHNNVIPVAYDDSVSCQELSYLFGYGPTFLAYNYYILKQHYAVSNIVTDQMLQEYFMFTEEHYRQIGAAYLKLIKRPSSEPIVQMELGYEHTKQVLKALALKLPYPMPPDTPLNPSEFREGFRLNFECDALALKTEYIEMKLKYLLYIFNEMQKV